MFLLVLVGTWAALLTGIVTVGEKIDDWLKEDTKKHLARYLAAPVRHNFEQWSQTTSKFFLNLFDRTYGGKWNLLEQGIWCGLLSSPLLMAEAQWLYALGGRGNGNSTGMLVQALISVGGLGLVCLLMIRLFWGSIYSVREPRPSSTVFGIIVGVIVGSVLVYITHGIYSKIMVVIFTISLGSVSYAIARGIINIPISPWKALISSLLFLAIVSIIWSDVGWAFFQAILANPLVLTYVAFNVFADGVSLWETRWVLQKGATAKVPALLGLLVLDFVLSGVIYLVLPLALWPQILDFWDAVRFQGEQPWLGLLFWTTFSTSFVFYAFVAAALLVRPLRAVTVGFGGIGKLFNLEEHPVRCLSVAMALVVTVIFAGAGVWEMVSGLGVAPAATTP